MSKKKTGRPLKGDSEKKIFSARLEEGALNLIKRKYQGSIQVWIDIAAQKELEKIKKKK